MVVQRVKGGRQMRTGGEQKLVWKILKRQWLAPEKSVNSGIPVWSTGLPTAPLHYCAVYARAPEMPLQL